MIIREHYMEQIRPFYESDLIKNITGIRRCGKSVILRQIMSEIEKAGKHCLFLDFDLRPVSARIPDADALIAYVNEYQGNDKLYVFLDGLWEASHNSSYEKYFVMGSCSLKVA